MFIWVRHKSTGGKVMDFVDIVLEGDSFLLVH